MEWLQAAWRQALFTLLRSAGPIPRHVAFIMDGNRRFAKREHLQRYLGHEHGCHKFVDVVKWCMELGVSYVSVYAFSIENFKRSPEEVQELMMLARHEYQQFKEHGLVKGMDIEVRVLGDVSRTNGSLQMASARLMQRKGKASERPVVNICFAYTSSQEVCRAVDICRTHVTGDVTEDDFAKLCFTSGCPDVDLKCKVGVRRSRHIHSELRLTWKSSILSYGQDAEKLNAMCNPTGDTQCRQSRRQDNVGAENPETSICASHEEAPRHDTEEAEANTQQCHPSELLPCLSTIQGTNDTISNHQKGAVPEKPVIEPPDSSKASNLDNGTSEMSQLFASLNLQRRTWITKHATKQTP